MKDEEELIYKRLAELSRKSEEGGYFTFTDFLGLSEQSVFAALTAKERTIRYTAFGGADGCERIMLRFGDTEELGYEMPFPIRLIKAEPKSAKYADALTHRDFLGAILNLGIERSTVGDILIRDSVGYIFVKDEIADYVKDSLIKVKHTDMVTSFADTLPDGIFFRTERMRILLSGERIDAAVAKVFSLSREDAQALMKRGLVFVNGRVCESNSYTPRSGDTVSARGHGRFIYRGVSGTSRKGKLSVEIELYV